MKNSTFLLKMKLTIILLLVAMMQVQARGYSQMITLKQQNAQLEDVFVEIMKQTNSKFVYSPTMLKATNPVNINLTNVTLEEALELCFERQYCDCKDEGAPSTSCKRKNNRRTREAHAFC